jgi:hypothetical protein
MSWKKFLNLLKDETYASSIFIVIFTNAVQLFLQCIMLTDNFIFILGLMTLSTAHIRPM